MPGTQADLFPLKPYSSLPRQEFSSSAVQMKTDRLGDLRTCQYPKTEGTHTHTYMCVYIADPLCCAEKLTQQSKATIVVVVQPLSRV